MDLKPKTLCIEGTPYCTQELCQAPYTWVMQGNALLCMPPAPTPPPASAMQCELSIGYPASDPANPTLQPMGPWCDAAGTELAVAVILARLLGARTF